MLMSGLDDPASLFHLSMLCSQEYNAAITF